MEDVMKKYYRDVLLDQFGLSFDKDNYRDSSAYRQFVKADIRGAWNLEKELVGEKRIKEIYGIYGMGIENNLPKNALEHKVWTTALADKFPYLERSNLDIERIIYRDELGSGKRGLISRMKSLGVDMSQFQEDSKWVKLVFFLYCFEEENNINLASLFKKPTLENADNIIVGDNTRNGEYIHRIRYNLMKEIDDIYIDAVGETIDVLGVHTNMVVKGLMQMDYNEMQEKYNCLKEMRDKSAYMLQNDNGYKDDVMETFYLKIEQHQMIGRQQDMLDIIRKYKNKQYPDCHEKEEYMRLRNMVIEKDELAIYLKEYRKEFAKLVFNKDKVSSNELKKYDRMLEQVEKYVEILVDNTFWNQDGYLPILAVICLMQEIIENKEFTENTFYHAETNDTKRRNTELFYGKQALRKNQLEWNQNVRHRYNALVGENESWILRCEMEELIQEILINTLKANSLNKMIEIHNDTWFD